MRIHNPEKLSLLRFTLALKGYNLKTESDLLISCDDGRELFVTDDMGEAMGFASDLPFKWQMEEAADGA